MWSLQDAEVFVEQITPILTQHGFLAPEIIGEVKATGFSDNVLELRVGTEDTLSSDWWSVEEAFHTELGADGGFPFADQPLYQLILPDGRVVGISP